MVRASCEGIRNREPESGNHCLELRTLQASTAEAVNGPRILRRNPESRIGVGQSLFGIENLAGLYRGSCTDKGGKYSFFGAVRLYFAVFEDNDFVRDLEDALLM